MFPEGERKPTGWKPLGMLAVVSALDPGCAQQTIHAELPRPLSAQPSRFKAGARTYHQPSTFRCRTCSTVPFGIAMIRRPNCEDGCVLRARNASGGVVLATT